MIRPERIEQVARIVARAGLDAQTIAAMRETFTDMHFTYCSEDDVGAAKPFRRERGFNIYLVDGRGHCMRFTTDTAAATGLVIAERDDAANG